MNWCYRMGVFLIAAALMVATPAFGAEAGKAKDSPWEDYSISLGGFIMGFDTGVTLGAKEHGAGISVDMEDALGLDTTLKVFRVDALARFGSSRRHRVDFNYYDLRRSSTQTLGTIIESGGHTFPIGTTVDSYFNMRIIKGGYSYSLIQDERIDFALGVGLFVMPIETGISAAGIGANDESITAPLPTFALRFDFAITPQWFLRQSLEAFYLEMGSFRGALYTGMVAVEYKPWQSFGLGAGYNFFHVGIEGDGKDYPNIQLTGKIDVTYAGLLLYGKVFF